MMHLHSPAKLQVGRLAKRHGFSIPEMLAVIAIIVIIMSILLPAFGKSKEAACSVICQNHLSQIHKAFMNHRTETKYSEIDKLGDPFSWQTLLLPYMNNEQSTVTCCAHSSGGTPTNNSVSNIYLEVFSGSNHLYNINLNPGPFTLRVDKNSSDAILQTPNPDIPTGTRDSMADNVYRLYFEDLRPPGNIDYDFHDVVLEIEELENGSTKLTYIEDAAGYTFNLRAGDGTLIFENMNNGGITPPGSTSYSYASVASYGMNREIGGMARNLGENVILLLDYNRTVAEGGTSTIDPWGNWASTSETGVPEFARHNKKANVVFLSGEVKLMDTADIDPAITKNRNDLWLSD